MEDNIIKVLDKGFVRLVDKMGNDAAVVQAARVSYGEGTKTLREDSDLINYLMRHFHWTPFEMCEVKFHVKAPIMVFRHWMRHRAASYNEASARYSEIKDEFYVPDSNRIVKQSKQNKQCSGVDLVDLGGLVVKRLESDDFIPATWGEEFEHHQSVSFNTYKQYLDLGMAREIARVNMPLSMYSEFYFKADLRNLLNLIWLRVDPHAQFEIREYANALLELIKPIFPVTCAAFDTYCLSAITLNKNDILALKAALRHLSIETSNLDRFFSSKGEHREFLSKLEKITKE